MTEPSTVDDESGSKMIIMAMMLIWIILMKNDQQHKLSKAAIVIFYLLYCLHKLQVPFGSSCNISIAPFVRSLEHFLSFPNTLFQISFLASPDALEVMKVIK